MRERDCTEVGEVEERQSCDFAHLSGKTIDAWSDGLELPQLI